jgi:pyruvate kinase
LNSQAKIISKIETNAAVENIEAIVQASDAVMVARGDLAIETLTESVPVVQREVVGLGQKYAKPTIVATQMLMSMVETPEPSRAEVSDVATAVFMGADGVMLSEETANGKYPIEAVKMMKRIVLYAERNMLAKTTFDYGYQPTLQNAIAKSVLTMAAHIDAKAIVAETRLGTTALQISSHRPHIPVIAVTSEIRTAQQLSIVYDVKAYIRPDDPDAAFKLTEWLLEKGVFQKGDIVIRVSGHKPGVPGMTDTIKVRALN